MPILTPALLAATVLTGLLAPVGAADQHEPTTGVWPLQPRPAVVRGFDPPAAPWGAGHRGVDLLGHAGDVVHAALAGRVSFAGQLAGRGVVVVDHGGRRTTYEPVRASVTAGDRVGRGQPVGRLELAMSHCFPRACLHWGLIRGETYLDPLTLVGGGPVRLLPLDSGALAARSPLWLRPADAPADTPSATDRW